MEPAIPESYKNHTNCEDDKARFLNCCKNMNRELIISGRVFLSDTSLHSGLEYDN